MTTDPDLMLDERREADAAEQAAMSRFHITLEQLNAYMNGTGLLPTNGAVGVWIRCYMDGSCKVWSGQEQVYDGFDRLKAVGNYNRAIDIIPSQPIMPPLDLTSSALDSSDEIDPFSDAGPDYNTRLMADMGIIASDEVPAKPVDKIAQRVALTDAIHAAIIHESITTNHAARAALFDEIERLSRALAQLHRECAAAERVHADKVQCDCPRVHVHTIEQYAERAEYRRVVGAMLEAK